MLDVRAAASAPDRCVLNVVGELDLASAPTFVTKIEALLESTAPADIVLDLADLTFCDAAGLSALLVAWTVAGRGGRTLSVVGAHGIVEIILRVTEVTDVLVMPETLIPGVGGSGAG